MNVLAIPDLHCPGMLADFPDFLWQVKKKWKCDRFVCLGDVFNFGAVSYHLRMSHELNFDAEIEQARNQVKQIARRFPKLDVLVGNHDDLVGRRADDGGIPRAMLRGFNDFWGLPKTWKWHKRYTQLKVDGVIYQHGDRGRGGEQAAFKNAKDEHRSVVQGHHHSQCGIWYASNLDRLIFGMQAGCGMDRSNPIFQYAKIYTKKPIIACGVIIDGKYPYIERMVL